MPNAWELIDVIAASETGDLAFLVSEQGEPFASPDSFGVWFEEECKEAGLGRVNPHGLRKTGATRASGGWRDASRADGNLRIDLGEGAEDLRENDIARAVGCGCGAPVERNETGLKWSHRSRLFGSHLFKKVPDSGGL